MIGTLKARIIIGCEEKAFEGDDLDKFIADIDAYLVSMKSEA